MASARAVLVDTSFLVALLDPRDALNEVATELAEQLDAKGALLLTADVVFLELCAYFARSPLRGEAIRWVTALRASAGWEVVPADRATMRRAEDRYRHHEDKAWSLTDCFLMELLDARGIEDVATSDHHFEQAGYRALLRG